MWFDNKTELFSDFPARWEAYNENNEEEELLSMPCFEVSNAEDRPFAPPAEDYPIGCEVELRDIEFARVAQESKNWDSVLDLLFALPRRMVKVTRHDGDYSFVECTEISGFNRIGCTLYRACLSEPKVKTTKYFAGIASCAIKNYEGEEEDPDSNKNSQFYHQSDFNGKFDRSEKSEISLQHDEWALPMREYDESFSVVERVEHEKQITMESHATTTTTTTTTTTATTKTTDNNVEQNKNEEIELEKKSTLSARYSKRINNRINNVSTSTITPQEKLGKMIDHEEYKTTNMTETIHESNHTSSTIHSKHLVQSYKKRHLTHYNSENENVLNSNNMTNSEIRESSNHEREKQQQVHPHYVNLDGNADKIISSDIDLEALLSEPTSTNRFTSNQQLAPRERSRTDNAKPITDTSLEEELLQFTPHDRSSFNNDHYTRVKLGDNRDGKDVIDTLQRTSKNNEEEQANMLTSQQVNDIIEVIDNKKSKDYELDKSASKESKLHSLEKPPLVNVRKNSIHNEHKNNVNNAVAANDHMSNTKMYEIKEDLNRVSKKVSRRSVRPIVRELVNNKTIAHNVSSSIINANTLNNNKNIQDGNKYNESNVGENTSNNNNNNSKHNHEKNDFNIINESVKSGIIKWNDNISLTPSEKSAKSAVDISKNNNICQTDSNMIRSRLHHHNRFALAMRKGTEAINKRNYEQALFYYNLALSELPEEESRVISSRSVAYLLMNEPEKALEDAKRVIQLEPNSFLGYVRAGNVLRSMKMMGEAQSCYKEAFQRDPHNAVVRKLLMSNSVAMLYETRVKRCLRFKIVYDDIRNQIVAVARQGAKAGDVLLKESTSLFATLNYFTFENNTLDLDTTILKSQEQLSNCNKGRFCVRPINRHESTTNSILSIRSVDNDMDHIEEWNYNFDSVNSVEKSNNSVNNSSNHGCFFNETNANANNGNGNGSSAYYQSSKTNEENTSTTTESVESVNVCGHCCTPLIDVDEVCQRTAHLDAKVVRSFYTLYHWVRCNYDCGTLYCSEECKTRAWAESHWVECVKHGRWRVGIHALFTYLHQCERSPRLMKRLISNTHSLHQGNSESKKEKQNESNTDYDNKELCGSHNSKNRYKSSTCSCAEEGFVISDNINIDDDDDEDNDKNNQKNKNAKDKSDVIDKDAMKIHFIIACMRITIRMLCRMLSCVWALEDALHMYDWLRIYSSASAERARLWPFVHHCYNLLSQSFYGRERQRLTYEVFERCFERVRSNAIIICVSAWDKIYLRAESHLALTRSDSTDSKNLQHFAEKESITTSMYKQSNEHNVQSVNTVHSTSNTECVQTIIDAPAYGLPGTYTICVALFELYAATLQERKTEQATTSSTVSTETQSTATVEVSSPSCSSNAYSNTLDDDNEIKGNEKKQGLKNSSKSLQEQKKANCKIQSKLESSACLHLCAINNIVRGEPLLSQNKQQIVGDDIMRSYEQSITLTETEKSTEMKENMRSL